MYELHFVFTCQHFFMMMLLPLNQLTFSELYLVDDEEESDEGT